MPSRRSFLAAAGGTLGLTATGYAGWSGAVTVPYLSPVLERWRSDDGARTLLARNGRLFLTRRRELVTLDAATGETSWHLSVDDRPYFGAVVDAEAVYAGDEELLAATHDGEERWRVDLEPHFGNHALLTARPALVDERLYAGIEGGRGYLAAFSTSDGSPAWSTDVGNWYVRTLAASDGRVFAALRSSNENWGRVTAFDATSGEQLWDRRVNDWNTTLTVGDALYATVARSAGTGGVGVLALDPTDGTDVWRYDLPHVNAVTLHDGTLYVVSGRGDYATPGKPEGALTALDAATGEERWRRDTELYGKVPPSVGDDRVYVVSPLAPGKDDDYHDVGSTTTGTVLAYTTDGEPHWRHWMGDHNPPSVPPVYDDGTLYVGGGGSVFALEERDW